MTLNQMKMIFFFLAGVSPLATGCVSSIQPEVTLAEEIDEDKAYNAAFKESTRDFEIIKNFETRSMLHATRLSPQFIKAFSDRYQKLFNETQPALQEAVSKTGFFVVLYTGNRDMMALDDERLWNVQLEVDGTLHKPASIKRLSPKERWQPFFKNITPWSQEYLVIYDVPNATSDPQLLAHKSLKMLVSNADGRVAIGW